MFIFNFLQAGMVIFIESITFADVLGYIYENLLKASATSTFLVTILSLSCKIILDLDFLEK